MTTTKETAQKILDLIVRTWKTELVNGTEPETILDTMTASLEKHFTPEDSKAMVWQGLIAVGAEVDIQGTLAMLEEMRG
jgi:hypothetical protein